MSTEKENQIPTSLTTGDPSRVNARGGAIGIVETTYPIAKSRWEEEVEKFRKPFEDPEIPEARNLWNTRMD